jgi:response regulator RpfG family c-di-GMP phosphodiesterase
MIKKTDGEKWRQCVFDNWETMQRKYAVSNMGNVASYVNKIEKDGELLKGSEIEGYKVLRLRVNGTYVAFLFHRLVALYFLRKPVSGHDKVIHLNHKKEDNRAENLKWATKEMVAEHNKNSPAVKAYRKRMEDAIPDIKKGLKLTLVQVKQIKKTLANPKRKLTHKQLAEKYGVSEMAITRIKRGENWGYVTF